MATAPDAAFATALIAQLNLFHRMMILWVFVLVGLVLSLQLSQLYETKPLKWTVLTTETRPYWYTLYVFEAFLLLTSAYPILLNKMEGYAFGYEEKLLNGIWIGLLGIEALMVLGVAVRGLVVRFAAKPKEKTN